MDYCCNICNKYYKTYQTLWKHNKYFHINNVPKNSDDILISSDNIPINTELKKYNCRICSNSFNNVKTRWSHEQKCKLDKNNKDTIKEKELELQIKKEEAKIKREEAAILRLKLKLQNSDKVENVTLRKLNKLLRVHQTRIKNSTVNSHNNNNNTNIQNNITNNFQLIGFGKEDDLHQVLTNKEKKMILNSHYASLEKLIKIVHCGKYNQFKNIIITNMKDNYMYKYDEKEGMFILRSKAEVLNSLIDYRLGDLEIIYNELLEKNKIDDNTKDCIEKFINEINYNNSKFTDIDGKEHSNYREYKISEIKILLFNNLHPIEFA